MKDNSGATLGHRISAILVDALRNHESTMFPFRHEAATVSRTIQLEQWEKEFAPILEDFINTATQGKELPDDVAAILKRLTKPTHQVETALIVAAAIGFVVGLLKVVAQPWIQSVMNKMWHAFPNNPLGGDIAAQLAQKGIWEFQKAQDEAADSGVDSDRFGALIANLQVPPSLGMIIEGMRLGLVTDLDAGTYLQLMGQNPDNWGWIKKLAYLPPGVADIVNAAVQNQISQADAQALAEKMGLDPQYFPLMYNTFGMPIAIGEALMLMNRGEMSQAEVEQAIREGHTKDKYIAPILKLAEYRAPPRTVATWIGSGAVTPAEGATLLAQAGVNPTETQAYLKQSVKTKVASTKNLAEGQVMKAYTELLITAEQATTMLTTLDYTAPEVALMLSVADNARENAFREKAVSLVGSRYVSRKITRTQASADLDTLQIAAAARDQILNLWDLEKAASPRLLTEAEVVKYTKGGVLTTDQCAAYLSQLGFQDTDVAIIMTGEGIIQPATGGS